MPLQPYVNFGKANLSLKGEDRSVCWSGLIGDEQIHLFLVADGHGGVDAANHCAETVLPSIRELASDDPSGPSWRRACSGAFERANADLRARPGCNSGCTLSVCCVNATRCEVTCANVGDSTVLLVPHGSSSSGGAGASTSVAEAGGDARRTPRIGRSASESHELDSSALSPTPLSAPPSVAPTPTRAVPSALTTSGSGKEGSNGSRHKGNSHYNGFFFARLGGGGASSPGESEPPVEQLSEDHRLAHSILEQRRVVAGGGQVAQAIGPSGGPEGPLRVWPGGLAVARVIGDADCGPFVSASPAVRTSPLPASGASVVLCSDGVWDCCTFETVGGLIRRGMKRRPNIVHAQLLAEQICAKATRARGGMLFDDTTCVVVTLMPPRHEAPMAKSVHAGSAYPKSVGAERRSRGPFSLFIERIARSMSPSRVTPSDMPSSASSNASSASTSLVGPVDDPNHMSCSSAGSSTTASPAPAGTRKPPGSGGPPTTRFSPKIGARWKAPATRVTPMELDVEGGNQFDLVAQDITEVEDFIIDEEDELMDEVRH